MCILSCGINVPSGADCDLGLTRFLRPNDDLHDPFCLSSVFVLRERFWSNSWSHAYLCQNAFCNFRSAEIPASTSGIVRDQVYPKLNLLKDFADTNILPEEMVPYASPQLYCMPLCRSLKMKQHIFKACGTTMCFATVTGALLRGNGFIA